MKHNDGSAAISRRQLIGGVIASTVAAAWPFRRGQAMTAATMPTLFLPHGGGPCFYMQWSVGPPDTWERMGAWLRGINASLPATPTALLVISAHWEEPTLAVTTAKAPPLLFDYSGFPPHTYELTWPAPGSPELAARIRTLLGDAGLSAREEPARGYDHGVFVPLKLTYPQAQIPTVQLSLCRGLDPLEHLAIGRALEPLRREGVFIVGSGMSYHNMRGFMQSESLTHSERFDTWLTQTAALTSSERDRRLGGWSEAPSARACHPREEHLLPLMVCAGAAGADAGRRVFSDTVMGVRVSALQFG